jgi:hypothetical protein
VQFKLAEWEHRISRRKDAKRFSEEQIVELLREVEKGYRSIGKVCWAHNVSKSAFYRWRNHSLRRDAFTRSQAAQRFKKGNARLKHLSAERCLEIDIINDVLSKPAELLRSASARRESVKWSLP